VKKVLSLYDFTGEAVLPWARHGFECFCFDIQHSRVAPRRVTYSGGGSITFLHADLHDRSVMNDLATEYRGQVAFMMAFPVCTDMAVSGARHFEAKAEADALFQEMAADHARWCGVLGESLGCPFFIENPVSTLATQWRKADHAFHPYEYGGYIPEAEADHPTWPDYIAPRDAYPKKTCLWTGGGFVMPERQPVPCGPEFSQQYKKLGGKSLKTKNIRSATPRGFAAATFEAHAGGAS
jgi:hypothetical protein